jgi:TetR/AcrR family transcriptional regulator, repressor of fatR-cypB operon
MLTEPSEPKVERILKAALALFATQGFDGTAMPQLAARAGVGMGTIYRHFATKEALGNAVFRHWKAKLGTLLAECLAGPWPAEARFLRAWRTVIVFAETYPLAFQFLEGHYHARYLDAESRAIEAASAAPTMAFLGDAGVGNRATPSALGAALMWGALVGVVKARAAGALALDGDTIDRSGRAVWRALAEGAAR